MKLLLTGDLHLGRTSTRLPDAKREAGRAISGWRRLVEAALEESVHAVVLSGDVLDQRDAFWEASSPFREGIDALGARGIHTVAVAGNHDVNILPDLAASLPPEHFTLLGANGNWERITLKENGTPMLHLDGWSFKSSTQRTDPTASYPSLPSDGLPVLGVVHGDPGVPDSKYAPLSLSRLQSLPVQGWLLGHIHKPSFTPGTPWVLMPGSPHPLDPGEPDAHHAWLIDTQRGTLSDPVPCCPAALRYRTVTLPLSEQDSLSYDAILRRLEQAVQEEAFEGFQLLRVRFTGQHAGREELEALTRTLPEWEHPEACVESVRVETHAPLDLPALQEAGPVPALLVEALNQTPPDLRKRLEGVMRELRNRREFRDLDLPEIEFEDLDTDLLLEDTLRAVKEHLS
jgi:DNA repair exonuclease SbcCD nuclease subunit